MKKNIVCLLLILMMLCFAGCAKEEASVSDYVKTNVQPEMQVSNKEINIDFIEMHNTILEQMMQEYTPFFYIKENSFDISGENNDPKKIIITIDCAEGTTKQDVDLFLSYVLSEIGANASEQNYKYEPPKTDSEGTFIDFGTVYNDYALTLKATVEGKEIIYDTTILKGNKIPIEPRYWSE